MILIKAKFAHIFTTSCLLKQVFKFYLVSTLVSSNFHKSALEQVGNLNKIYIRVILGSFNNLSFQGKLHD
ncbi:MAG TPA: hypothetical protein DCK95_09250 [Anaerolineaceae bacterium]|nr:hypothetical protein [Anaerolineaceae bacterium]